MGEWMTCELWRAACAWSAACGRSGARSAGRAAVVAERSGLQSTPAGRAAVSAVIQHSTFHSASQIFFFLNTPSWDLEVEGDLFVNNHGSRSLIRLVVL